MVELSPAIVAQLSAQAVAEYPGECCGLLFAAGAASTSASRALPLENLADRLHAMDPAEYPRTSRDAFAVNEAKLARVVREAQAGGERWLAFYHSHIDCDAYFSAEDKRFAAPGGVPIYPQILQIVIACRERRITDAKAFLWDGHDYALVQTLPGFATP